ncbi:cupin domain-containing protein [Halobaculum halobium]|uniref:Cupin domain-containing protein n=1 Tax=Halobaculum halobium TaxID=3032281 RepID=A0ABD5T5U9_9EURY|nr:cupin domain-containing protein [Halobaculum sp. SYNS20]
MTVIERLDELEGEPHANVFPGSEPKTVRLALSEGAVVPVHSHPNRDVIFHLVDGAIELQVGSETHAVSAGDVARFDGDQDISPRAVEDSTALIVLAKQSDD